MNNTKISSKSDIESKLSEIYENFDSDNYIIEKTHLIAMILIQIYQQKKMFIIITN